MRPRHLMPVLALLLVPAGAEAAETVVDGRARFQVLTPSLIRLEYAEDGRFEDRPSLTALDRDLGPVRVTTAVEGDQRVIRTRRLELRYARNSGAFTEDNLEIALRTGDRRVVARPRWDAPVPVPPPDPSLVYQAAAPDPDESPRTSGNLGGWHRGLDQAVGPVRMHDGLLSRDGWYLLDDTRSALLEARSPGYAVRPAREGAYQDGYFFGYGLDYGRGLRDLRDLSGPPAFLPRKALGTWFSRYASITDRRYREEILPAFRRERVPLDVLVLDTDAREPKAWNGTQWRDELLPDPPAFLDWAHREKLDIALNQHPSISADDPQRADAEERSGGLLLSPSPTAQPRCRFFTADPTNTCGLFDFANPRHADTWFGLYEQFERDGLDFWWFDWCCDESVVDAPGLTADTWINQLYAERSRARGRRWPSLSRIGSSLQQYTSPQPGIWAEHRNAIHFTGDTFDRWEVLDFQTRFTASEGNVGIPWVSHDIGSFHGDKLDDELYARWIQLGAFQPILRLHSSSDDGKRLPWEYGGKAGEIAAEFMRLRGRLAPYLYALARQAYDTGLPIVRSTYLAYPGHDDAYVHDRQYMLGDDLLVSPVGTEGDPATKRVWFPPGEWFDIFTGQRHRGPAAKDLSVPLERMPVFVRAGGILPQQKAIKRVGNAPPRALTLRVQAGRDGRFALYDDAGDGLAYTRGAFARTRLAYEDPGKLRIGPMHGKFAGRPARRRWEVRFVSVRRPRAVTVDGRRVSNWRYDRATRTAVVRTGAISTRRDSVVRLRRGGRGGGRS